MFANTWEPVGTAPLLETYDVVMPSGPNPHIWRWTNRVRLFGTKVPRAAFGYRLTGRWGLHMRQARVDHHGRAFKPNEPRWWETVFWFEKDEDYLLLRMMGMFEGRAETGRPLLMDHTHQGPVQIEIDWLETFRKVRGGRGKPPPTSGD